MESDFLVFSFACSASARRKNVIHEQALKQLIRREADAWDYRGGIEPGQLCVLEGVVRVPVQEYSNHHRG